MTNFVTSKYAKLECCLDASIVESWLSSVPLLLLLLLSISAKHKVSSRSMIQPVKLQRKHQAKAMGIIA